MNEKIYRQEIVKRASEKLKQTKIEIGGNGKVYKRKYHLAYTQQIIDNVLMALLEVVVDAIREGDSIGVYSYGMLVPKYHKEKTARNVYGNTEYTIPARYRVKFNPSTHIEDACKELTERDSGKNDADKR